MNFKSALSDLRDGLREKYPLCCILQFCLETLIDDPATIRFRHIKGKPYIPCSLHMKAYHMKEGLTKEILKFFENDCQMYYKDVIREYRKNITRRSRRLLRPFPFF